MGLEAATDFINLLVSTTGNICARHHSHPSFCPCKFVCLNLYRDRSDLGDLVDKEALEWTREKFEATQHLLGSMDPPAEYGCKLAFPDLEPVYGRDSLEELFDKNNTPTSSSYVGLGALPRHVGPKIPLCLLCYVTRLPFLH